MSRADKIIIVLTITGLILAGIQTWDVLDKRNLVIAVLAVISWMCGAGMVTFGVTRMLLDIGRAKRTAAILESERLIHAETVASLQEELRKRQEGLAQEATRHHTEMADLKKEHQAGVEALKDMHAKNIKDARRTVINSARWGIGGPYNSDQTALLQILVDRDIEDLCASTEFFPDCYPGEKKLLTVEYFSPFSARIERRTFQEGEEIDFGKLARSSSTHT
jgi:hypothetical protein